MSICSLMGSIGMMAVKALGISIKLTAAGANHLQNGRISAAQRKGKTRARFADKSLLLKARRRASSSTNDWTDTRLKIHSHQSAGSSDEKAVHRWTWKRWCTLSRGLMSPQT